MTGFRFVDLEDDEDAEGEHSHGDGAAAAFPLVPFDEIHVDTQRRSYLVKGLLASTGIAVVWGPPKCGKSFWAADLGLHIALGWEYRGRRVQQATAIYVALEGRHGFPARIEAFRQHHGVDAAPFYLLTTTLDLIADAAALIASIKAQLGAERPGVLFLDTLNRSLVGSESKDEDMGRYLAAAERVTQELGCIVVVVHHCGIDATRPRGHTSLSGTVESQLSVRRGTTGEVIVTVELAKDFAEGAEIFSRLESVDVGIDPDGDKITSLVVLPAERGTEAVPHVNGAVKIALEALYEAIGDFGLIPPVTNHIPSNTRTISVVRWRELCEAKMIADSDKPDSKRRAFVRASNRLQSLKIIGVWKDQVWVAGQAGQART